MVALSRTTLAAAGTLAIAVIGMTMFGAQAQALPRNLCESATAKGTISCCNTWMKSPDGRTWRRHGFNCASPRAVVCKVVVVDYAAAVVKKKKCYINQSPIYLLTPPGHDHDRPNNSRTSRGQGNQNGNKP